MVKSNDNVTSVTSLGRNGLYDWIMQRVSAIVIGLYFIFMVGYLMSNQGMDYATWKAFMGSLPMQVINSIVFLMIAAHAWIGIWTVLTDYVTKLAIKKHYTGIRLTVTALVALLVVVYLLLGLYFIWGGM